MFHTLRDLRSRCPEEIQICGCPKSAPERSEPCFYLLELRDGADQVCWNTPYPDPNGHTAVSFILVNGIPGRPIGEWKY